MQFILKNTLHLTPAKLSFLGFLTDGPVFVAFAFGFLRDRWSPFRKGDRGYFLLLPPLLACANLILAFGPFTYGKILGILLLMTACGVLLGSAVRGLMTVLAQMHGMAGRLSVLLLLTPRLVSMIASAIGGHLAVPEYQHLSFLISAALCLPVMAMAFWKPRVVFAHARENQVRLVPEGTLDALKRFMRHRPLYLPAAIMFFGRSRRAGERRFSSI